MPIRIMILVYRNSMTIVTKYHSFDAIAPDLLHYTLDNMWGLRRITPDMYASPVIRKDKDCMIAPGVFLF